MYVCMYVPTYVCNILCGSVLCMYIYTHVRIILSGHVLRTYVRIIPSGRVLCMHTLMYYTKWKRAMYVCMYVCILNGTYVYTK